MFYQITFAMHIDSQCPLRHLHVSLTCVNFESTHCVMPFMCDCIMVYIESVTHSSVFSLSMNQALSLEKAGQILYYIYVIVIWPPSKSGEFVEVRGLKLTI